MHHPLTGDTSSPETARPPQYFQRLTKVIPVLSGRGVSDQIGGHWRQGRAHHELQISDEARSWHCSGLTWANEDKAMFSLAEGDPLNDNLSVGIPQKEGGLVKLNWIRQFNRARYEYVKRNANTTSSFWHNELCFC